MRTILLGVLYLIALGGLASSGATFARAISTWQSAEALLLLLIGVVAFGFAVVVQTLEAVRDEIEVGTRMHLKTSDDTRRRDP